MEHEELRREVLETARALLALGLTVGNSGNVSARVPHPERLLLALTPHARHYDEMTPEDVLIVDEEGEPVAGDGIPSVELGLHAALYRARPEAGAVIHAHPPMAGAAAVFGRAIPPILEDQMIYLGGQIEIAPPASSGSSELVQGALAALGEHNACLLGNHGALAVGRDPRSALFNCQYLEKLSQVFLFATWAGNVNVLPPDVAEAGMAFFRMGR